MAEPEPSYFMSGSPQCYTCQLHGREPFQGEVWYDKVQRWSCLLCHLAEKNLQYSSKWKGIVKRICRKCEDCGADLSSEEDSAPRWYCYDCRQFLCNNCVSPDIHNDEKSRVSCSYGKKSLKVFNSKLLIACTFYLIPNDHLLHPIKPLHTEFTLITY